MNGSEGAALPQAAALPDRELDRLLAEATGWASAAGLSPQEAFARGCRAALQQWPEYSKDLNEAWQAVESLAPRIGSERYFSVELHGGGMVKAGVRAAQRKSPLDVSGRRAARVVCEALARLARVAV